MFSNIKDLQKALLLKADIESADRFLLHLACSDTPLSSARLIRLEEVLLSYAKPLGGALETVHLAVEMAWPLMKPLQSLAKLGGGRQRWLVKVFFLKRNAWLKDCMELWSHSDVQGWNETFRFLFFGSHCSLRGHFTKSNDWREENPWVPQTGWKTAKKAAMIYGSSRGLPDSIIFNLIFFFF